MNLPVSSPEINGLREAGGADELTVLSHPHRRLTKLWRAGGTIDSYEGGTHFAHRTVALSGIVELADFLGRQASRPRECVIRGKYLGDAVQLEREPADYQRNKVLRRKSCFADQALHAIMVDIDRFEPLEADPITEPEQAIEQFILTCLPSGFADVSYCWQLSSSAGAPDKRDILKAHVWFWLEAAATSTALRTFFKDSRYATVDVALFDPIQIHYTADPVFEQGVVDPVPRRSGFVERSQRSVMLDVANVPIAEKPSRQQKLDGAIASDPTVQALNERGMLKGGSSGDGIHITCPFEHEHSGDSGPSSTVYYPAHTGGYERGHFKCLHAHCVEKTDGQFREQIGMVGDGEDDFEIVEPAQADAPAVEAPTERPNSFQLASQRAQAPIKPDLVRGVIPDAEFGIIYGKSGSGKSFAAIDLGYHLARGVPWRGRKVKQRNVFYVAAEGAEGVRRRTTAFCLYHDVDASTPFYTREHPINLYEKNAWKKAASDIVQLTGAEPGVIFIDTLSRSMAGVDENSAKDMSLVIENCQKLARTTGCMVIVIAHAGKNDDQGVRGSSALRAAADFEIAVSRHLETQWRALKLTKSKDDVDGTEFPFVLEPVGVGLDEDGDAVFSAVPVPTDAAPAAARRPQGPKQRLVYDALDDLAAVGGSGSGVDLEKLIDYVLTIKPDASKNARSNLRQVIDVLVESAFFSKKDGLLYSLTPENSFDLL